MTQELTPEQSLLGRATPYRSDYAPELLFPIPRQQKRDELRIRADALPFVGEDVWNAYELSWLNARGKPQVAVGVFRIPAYSPCLIESKSLKLYLNSLNQTPFADVDQVRACVRKDLSQAAGAEVSVEIFSLDLQPQRTYAYPDGMCIDALDIAVDRYQPAPELLQVDAQRVVADECLYSHLLKSNCLVTGQPDWGSVIIRYSGPAIDQESLLRYIISFRQHNEFHEQCVERIYTDIMARCQPQRLAVWARYTRRGGLDINPFRSSERGWTPDNLFEMRQ